MTATLHAYPAHKPSCVPWLGDVPAHWGVERGKWLLKKMGRPVSDTDEVVTCFRDGVVTLRKKPPHGGFYRSIEGNWLSRYSEG